MTHRRAVEDGDHKHAVADVECVHVLLQRPDRLRPQHVRPCLVSQRALEARVQALLAPSVLSQDAFKTLNSKP